MKFSSILIALLGCFTTLTFADIEIPSQWEYTAPLIAPEERNDNPSHAQKDPTLVYHEGKWHVFMTVKLQGRSAIEYCSFEKWENAQASERTMLKVSDSDYFCAPQVFYFEPHAKWYLVYQAGMPGSNKMWVAYSTTTDITDSSSWTKARPMPGLGGGPDDPREVGGLDFWIICDEQRAYLFLTSLNGKMWQLSTEIDRFPGGFGDWQLALDAAIFEASHTYKLKGQEKYLTIIEQDGRRYFKAYVADRLDGKWTPIADTEDRPFAGASNIRPEMGVDEWTDNISHGELVRDSNDQRLVVDPDDLQLVFQGMLEKHKSGSGYGQFNWRLGLLRPSSTLEVVLVGDSTVTATDGWGAGFAELLADSARVYHAARNGRSSKSFRDEGHWESVIKNPGDYLLIQFGHNDQPGKGPERESPPETDFREHLRQYVEEARAVGMKPILVTSLTRRHWDQSGKIRPSLAEYAMATKAVAIELGVPLVDLHELSIAHANATGVEGYEKYEPRTDKGIDHTHLNLSGSRVIGKLVAQELVRVVPALAQHFNLQSDERPAVSWVNPTLPDGPGLKHHVLASKAMGYDVGYVVSTPAGYDASGKARYPVIYFLHGMGGNESADAGGFSGLVRGATRAGKMPPAICVFPNGGRSGYRGDVEKMIIDELIPLIDQTYPTNARAASRAVAGFSMGGAGAVRLSLLHPGLFCGAGSWGGGMRRGSDELVAAAENLKDKDFAFLLVNGDEDHPAAYDPLTTRLETLGIAHKVTVLKDTPHNLGLYYERAGAEMAEFLGKQLRKQNHAGIPRIPGMAHEAWAVTIISQISKGFRLHNLTWEADSE